APFPPAYPNAPVRNPAPGFSVRRRVLRVALAGGLRTFRPPRTGL
ncbi:MAG: hypothetical protein AVDCRST_MAG56-6667, partial [uncultured Cytophagales bacterium]